MVDIQTHVEISISFEGDESSGNSSCKIEEIEDEASSVPSINKAQCKSK